MQVRVRSGQSYCLGTPTDIGQALIRVRAFCPGDTDRNGVTNVPDIFTFLSFWFSGDRRADMDCSGANEVPDIFTFLSYWFAPCDL